LSEIAGGDPLILVTSRGWWCPKERRYMRELMRFQDEVEVAYTKLVVISVDPPEVQHRASARSPTYARSPTRRRCCPSTRRRSSRRGGTLSPGGSR
jgi:hypothetical protein